MKRKNMARNALFTSIMSLLLCVSMLVGTTFAWFTDEVVTGMNTIAAGNLDVELLANGVEVDSTTKLFDDVTLWEPGAVVYENLQVVNAGTLALKYQMSLNFGNENDLNGHKLSEVLKVVVLNETIDASTMTRAQVLEKAKAAAEADQGAGSLSNFYLTGELEAKTSGAAFAVVVFWAPNDNATDNLYNANNGKATSDGEPLHIEFGVNLQATQKMSESDSFGSDYDKFSSILPKATVNNTGAQTVSASTSFGGSAASYDLDTSFQFLPNETQEEAATSEYKYWHADYVISADKAVPANSMALAGYYSAFCDGYNNGNWVVLTADQQIAAGTEIRLVEALGGGSITVNYGEICQYANDGIGFKCGAVDLTGANIGTTITVELRLYETTVDPENPTGNKNEETGKYEVIGKYTYTFGDWEVATAEELQAAINEGISEIKLTADLNVTDTAITVPAGKTISLDLNGNTIAGASTTTGKNKTLFVVKGDLAVSNGSVTMTHTGDNMGWNNLTAAFSVEGGKLTLDNVDVVNNGGSDMAFGVDVNTTLGTTALDINNGTTITSTYTGVRIFNNHKTATGTVNLNNGVVSGGSRDIWMQKASSTSVPENGIVNINDAYTYEMTTQESGGRIYQIN